jgi:hypothetical protein
LYSIPVISLRNDNLITLAENAGNYRRQQANKFNVVSGKLKFYVPEGHMDIGLEATEVISCFTDIQPDESAHHCTSFPKSSLKKLKLIVMIQAQGASAHPIPGCRGGYLLDECVQWERWFETILPNFSLTGC